MDKTLVDLKSFIFNFDATIQTMKRDNNLERQLAEVKFKTIQEILPVFERQLSNIIKHFNLEEKE